MSEKEYEKLLDKQIAKVSQQILAIYNDAIQDISFATYLKYRNFSGTTFSLDTQPALKKALNALLSDMHSRIVKAINQAVTDAWGLSNEKNDQIANDIIQRVFPQLVDNDKKVSNPATNLIFNPNHDALKAFSKRVESGMNLSDRVWNLIKPYKFELEAGLTDGINRGLSAAKMASNLKRYLNEPEKLFRRVRDENGKLQLSKAARNYHPGQGVYRSSFQNALRLTGTEVNMSYRTADHNRWKNQIFVKGIEIKTSNNHPHFDECDQMAGKYPKDFLFRGWHVKCRCYSIPVLISDEEFSKQEDVFLGLTKKQPKIKEIDKIPASARDWIADNAERMKGWKSLPYWVKDNPKYVNL